MFLTTSCVDLTQEPQSFITEEEYIARMDLTSLQQATTGLYNDLWKGNYGFNCRLQRINVCADDITYRAAKANNELANYYQLTPNITANNADYKTTWELFFTVINNSNKLIQPDNDYYYPYATGLKTGMTDYSGHCVVATAERFGHELIIVTLGSENAAVRWNDTIALFDAGFAYIRNNDN